ncbi:hypothetical protein ACLMJK_006847 [Lecanora helva]
MSKHVTATQLQELEIIERIFSCLSLLGTSFIFFTFLYSPHFRRPVNRLIFYASWGNTLCNVATLLSQSGVRAGRDSHLCQFQGFLIQMFLPADALWNLAMAINVYMTLFRKYNAQQLKSLEWKYHLLCYGFPFLVALIYLFIDTPGKGKMYGPATLWCWIDIEWVAFRIALLYAPAWCCIFIAFSIYVIAGREIFKKRKQLRAFGSPCRPAVAQVENPFMSYKTTEIHITSEIAPMASYLSDAPDVSLGFENVKGGLGATSRPSPSRLPSDTSKGYNQYTVEIRSTPVSPRCEVPPPPKALSRNNRAAMDANTAAWAYTKVALLFFISLLVTWVPSSINRVYSLIYPELISVPFTFASAVVLPSMGFWNSVIYITTSWAAVRMLFTGRLKGQWDVECPSKAITRRIKVGDQRRIGSESDDAAPLSPGRKASGYNQMV